MIHLINHQFWGNPMTVETLYVDAPSQEIQEAPTWVAHKALESHRPPPHVARQSCWQPPGMALWEEMDRNGMINGAEF